MRRQAFGLDAETMARISYQGTSDDMQMQIADAESKGKRFLIMDHPYYLMSSAFVDAQLGSAASGLEDKPIPVIEDRKFDIPVALRSIPNDFATHSNPTLLPDRFLFSFTPILTIRHPAHAIPSNFRATHSIAPEFPEFPIGTSFRFPRLLFDSFKARDGAQNPIVTDGGRLIRDPQGQMKKLCELLGLDEGEIRYTGDETIGTLESRESKLNKAFLGTFLGSKGVIPNERYNERMDIREEAKKWVEEWGEAIARMLEEKMVAAMEDYEYLLQYSL
ncbi:hypothetical protein V5O48_015808 [Marasmius crinis-equi]|uniref:Uncharacterized protein n=1 Tax=Marasmius crinis-equi TaxID=585013 RepID=A0ABR3ETJ6_9AGAR